MNPQVDDQVSWRRLRGSNPRGSCPPTRFPGVCLRPLGQASAGSLRQGLRQGWDSNPWMPCDINGFRDRPIRPLWHLAVEEYSGGGGGRDGGGRGGRGGGRRGG